MNDEISCKKLRRKLKLTMEELAAKINEEQAYIWLLENGYPHRVPAEIQERIEKKLEDL